MYHQDPIPSEKARFEYLHSFYSKINRGISRPSLLVHKLLNFLYGCNLLSDKLFLSLKFRLKMGGGINWKSPHTFNRKNCNGSNYTIAARNILLWQTK